MTARISRLTTSANAAVVELEWDMVTMAVEKPLTRSTPPTILKRPALPISYGDAKIMARMEGPMIECPARSGLALACHWGETDAVKVHLAIRSYWSMKTLYDVIAVMPGRLRRDEWVARGTHHVGWVFGASDPLSGQVALMSEARAIGALAGAGWRLTERSFTPAATARSRACSDRPSGPTTASTM